jgi:opine dehydrogenase
MAKQLLIVGGANSAHVLSVLAGTKGYDVTVLTRKPDLWGPTVSLMLDNDTDVLKYNPRISSDAQTATDVKNIMICGPVSATLAQLESLKGSINRDQETYLGTIFGQGGFDYMTRSVFPKQEYPNLKVFSLQKIPWLCKATEYGQSARILGTKRYLNVSAEPGAFPYVHKMLNEILNVPVYNIPFLANLLIPANNIIHPGRYYGLFQDWNFKDSMYDNQKMPLLYEDIDQQSADWISKMDSELMTVVESLRTKFPSQAWELETIKPLRELTMDMYQDQISDPSTLRSTIATNKAYRWLQIPVRKLGNGCVPEPNHRFVQDDIKYGLCIIKDVAEMVDVPTPTIDRVLEWHQKFMGEELIVGSKLEGKDVGKSGALRNYGVTKAQDLFGA